MKGIYPNIITRDSCTPSGHKDVVMECYVEVKDGVYVQAKKNKLVKENFYEALPIKEDAVKKFIEDIPMFVKNYVSLEKFKRFEYTLEQVRQMVVGEEESSKTNG